MNHEMTKVLNSNKLKVCNVICTVYPLDIDNHNRCFNCHVDGHHSKACKTEVVCAYCAGPHRAGSTQCVADTPSCSNCLQAKKNDYKHPVYSPKCPFNQKNSMQL